MQKPLAYALLASCAPKLTLQEGICPEPHPFKTTWKTGNPVDREATHRLLCLANGTDHSPLPPRQSAKHDLIL